MATNSSGMGGGVPQTTTPAWSTPPIPGSPATTPPSTTPGTTTPTTGGLNTSSNPLPTFDLDLDGDRERIGAGAANGGIGSWDGSFVPLPANAPPGATALPTWFANNPIVQGMQAQRAAGAAQKAEQDRYWAQRFSQIPAGMVAMMQQGDPDTYARMAARAGQYGYQMQGGGTIPTAPQQAYGGGARVHNPPPAGYQTPPPGAPPLPKPYSPPPPPMPTGGTPAVSPIVNDFQRQVSDIRQGLPNYQRTGYVRR